jgi:hypothetical protein
VTAAALLVVCIGVEVDLAVVREHATAQARIDTAVHDAHAQAIKDLDTEQAAAPKEAVAAGPSIQVDGLDRKSARALGQGLAKGQLETAAQQEGFRKERVAHREAYIRGREQEARQHASQTNRGEMTGQVGMVVVRSCHGASGRCCWGVPRSHAAGARAAPGLARRPSRLVSARQGRCAVKRARMLRPRLAVGGVRCSRRHVKHPDRQPHCRRVRP